jgi:hypothetical protein
LVFEEGGRFEHETQVKLDERRPEIVRFPGGQVPVTRAGSPQIELRARDGLTGIARVEVARSGSRQEPFGEKDKLLEVVNTRLNYDQGAQNYVWQGELPADIAKPGETVPLVARVYDGVGHASPPLFAEVTLPQQTGPPPPPKGTIRVTADFRGTVTKAIQVELEGPDGLQRKASINAAGRTVQFNNLPAGDYKIKAAGEVRLQVSGLKEVSGDVAVDQFDPAKTRVRDATLKME